MYTCIVRVQVLLLIVLVCVNNSVSVKIDENVVGSNSLSAKNANQTSFGNSTVQQDVTKVQLKNVTSTAQTKPNTQETEVKHMPREHVIDNPMNTKLVANNVTKVNNASQTTNHTNTNVAKNNMETHNETIHSAVVSRKGVSFEPPEISSSTSSSTKKPTTTKKPLTTAKPLPQKPKVTVGSEDDVPIVESYHEVPKPKVNVTTPRIIEFNESYSEKKSHSADYVIPIIAVILSVPLVAIIISVLYKRFSDWWTHRNYRRMDFLIEGMYNN